MIIVQDLVSGTFYLWRKGSFLWKQRHLTNILFLYAWVKTRPVFNKSVRLVIKLQLRFECSCKCYLLAVRGPAHKYPSFLSFFFFFSFCPPVTRPGKKNNHRNTLVSLLVWKDSIGIFYEHDDVTAYNLKRNKNVSLPFCIFKNCNISKVQYFRLTVQAYY